MLQKFLHEQDIEPALKFKPGLRHPPCLFIPQRLVKGDGGGVVTINRTNHRMQPGLAGMFFDHQHQHPAKAPPYEYSRKGYQHILEVCANAGLTVET